MTRIQKILNCFFLCLASAVFLVAGGATAAENSKNANTAHWEKYSHKEANFTFRYPKGWEIIDDDFYETAGGAIATQRSVNLQKIGDEEADNWIRINPRQFDESDGKCVTKGKDSLCTYSKDAEVLTVFKKIVASFK
jgi:hypothetical protein